VVTAVCGVISLWLILSFFWKVYARGGESALSAAAQAVCKVYDARWMDKITHFLPGNAAKALEQDGEKNDEVAVPGGEAE
jgi:hypothetical protein